MLCYLPLTSEYINLYSTVVVVEYVDQTQDN